MSVAASRPNVLLFCADEMRADHLGCVGNRLMQTPNLDRLRALPDVCSAEIPYSPVPLWNLRV